MSVIPTQRARTSAYQRLALQGFVAVLLSVLVWWFDGPQIARSILFGASICWIVSAYAIRALPKKMINQPAKKWLHAFYYVQFTKILITAALFAFVIAYAEVAPLPFFIAYGVALVWQGFGPLTSGWIFGARTR